MKNDEVHVFPEIYLSEFKRWYIGLLSRAILRVLPRDSTVSVVAHLQNPDGTWLTETQTLVSTTTKTNSYSCHVLCVNKSLAFLKAIDMVTRDLEIAWSTRGKE